MHGIRYALRALGERDFAIFWLGALFGNLGGWMQSLAIPYVLFLQTDSATWVGLAGAAQFLPGMFLGPLGGVIAERHDLRRVLLTSQVVRALVALGLFLASVSGSNSPTLLLVLALVAGAAQGIQMPSWQSFVYRLVPREHLTSAITLNAAQFTLARSFGPALAGGMLLWWGAPASFMIACVAIMMVIAALLLIRFRQVVPPRARDERQPGVVQEFGKAMLYIRTQPGLIVAMSIIFMMGLLGMPIFQHVIVFSEKVFGNGRSGLALLNLGLGVGTVVAVPLLSGFEYRISRAKFAACSLPAFAVSIAAFSIAQTPAWGFLALIFVGAFYLCTHSVAQNSVQIIVASHMRGRVLALQVMISAGATALGCYLQGMLVDLIGPRLTVLLAAAMIMLFAWGLILQRDRGWLGRMNDSFDTKNAVV
jgi:predicted MFS family arabinose efflux permease